MCVAFSKAARKQTMSKAKRAQVPTGVKPGKSTGTQASSTPAAMSATPESEEMTTPTTPAASTPAVNEMAAAATSVVANQPAPGSVTGDSWMKRASIAAAGAAVGAAAVVAYQKFAPKFLGQAATTE